MKNVTISDVAKHAGVSKSTVSQFLNERYEYMSERTRKKIENSIRELNYRPNIVARSLSQKSTQTVGIIVANILHSFSTHIIRAVETNFNAHGFHTIVCNADDDPKKERQYIEMLLAKQVDGIIIFPTGDNIDLYKQMQKRKYPFFFVDRTIEGLNIPSILLANEQAAYMATDALIKSGYEHIAIMTAPITRKITPRMERIAGYKQALTNASIPVREEFIQSVEIDAMEEKLLAMLQLDVKPEAIIAGSDRVLVEILKYIKKHQLAIPNDLAVVVIDEVPYAELFTPALTTVAQPAEQMGQKAVELLLKQIKGEQSEQTDYVIRFEGRLNERESHKKL